MWVLDHGLPAMPEALGDDDEVPTAYWRGERFATVLFRSWAAIGEGEQEPAEGPDVDDDHYSWVLTETGWVPIKAGGGAGGPLRLAAMVRVQCFWALRDEYSSWGFSFSPYPARR